MRHLRRKQRQGRGVSTSVTPSGLRARRDSNPNLLIRHMAVGAFGTAPDEGRQPFHRSQRSPSTIRKSAFSSDSTQLRADVGPFVERRPKPIAAEKVYPRDVTH